MTARAMRLSVIDTDGFSKNLRAKAIDVPGRRLLVTTFSGSKQEKDLTVPANCKGLGRVRHFRRETSMGWPLNSLPIDPAAHALGLAPSATLRAQVFQNSVCNWRCWYCFVDFELLSGSEKHSQWVTAEELLDLYLAESDPPPMLDLTGGQPDLTPEWVPWMMEALERRGLRDEVYLWSDDNLSNDYFWKYLDESTRAMVTRYPKYGRVCCFKGYNQKSFSFNTRAAAGLFDRQFELIGRLIQAGLDIYAYVTLTTTDVASINNDMRQFVDRLQEVDPNLPLRTIPLEIRMFTPVHDRLKEAMRRAMELQHCAVAQWQAELEARFSQANREMAIWRVPLRNGRGEG